MSAAKDHAMPRDISKLVKSHRDLLRKAEVAEKLNVSVWTLDRWLKAGTFPAPIYLMPESPAQWRLRDIEAFIEKRKLARRMKRKPRGAVRHHGEAANA
jgi:predicted DNA-binding transcriptional regulator AlpA